MANYYDNRHSDEDIEIIYWGEEEDNNTVNSEKVIRKRHKRDKFNWKKEIVNWAVIIAVAGAAAFLINACILINATVPSGSMEKTIHKHSRMVGWRLSYVFSEPKRRDIIIFKYPDNPEENYVKRVIGLPGETLEIRDGIVYIDDSPIDESSYVYFSKGVPSGKGVDFEKITIPEDCYFVMGDNRNNSHDSRFWSSTHFVKKSEILGRAIFSYYPSFYLFE